MVTLYCVTNWRTGDTEVSDTNFDVAVPAGLTIALEAQNDKTLGTIRCILDTDASIGVF